MDYRYPPFFIAVFGWLALMPEAWAAYVWYWVCVLSIAGCVLVLHRISKPLFEDSGRGRIVVWVIAVLMLGPHFVRAMKLGNAHVLMTFLMYAAFYLALRYRVVLGGLLLSLAITIKVTPIFAIPYFAITRRWKFLAAVGIFLVVLNLAPAAYFGFGKNAELLRTWYQHVVVDNEFHETVAPIDVSLRGDTDYPSINFAAMSPQTVTGLWIFLVAAINLAGFGLIWFTTRHKDRNTAFLALGLVICLKLITVPQTARSYYIELLWPVVALGTFAFGNAHRAARVCRYLLGSLAAATIVLLLLPGRGIQRLMLVAGTDLYISSLLAAGLAVGMIAGSRGAMDSQASELRDPV